jgi:hypothetical protein
MLFPLPTFLSISFDPFGRAATSRVARRFWVSADGLGGIRRGFRFILCSLACFVLSRLTKLQIGRSSSTKIPVVSCTDPGLIAGHKFASAWTAIGSVI